VVQIGVVIIEVLVGVGGYGVSSFLEVNVWVRLVDVCYIGIIDFTINIFKRTNKSYGSLKSEKKKEGRK
jgi:hypothetical protein